MSAFDVTGEQVTAAFPEVGIDHTVSIPYDTMTYSDTAMKATTGVSISIVNTGVHDFAFGTVGDGVTSEFITMDGASFLQSGDAPDRLIFTVKAPRISAGASPRISPVHLTITESRIEIGARRRKIKTSAIAS